MDEAVGRAFIKGMNAKMSGRGSWKSVHQGYERQNEWKRQSECRSSTV
ncbi:hypothetical protein PU629_10270 [Pullulanibacillus sp. KACC 23026]|nr:hypothetical protein [Pullulanibacillus sp. KACC 23026]WEG14700.1 hypothetical protein PU629_10270 [Pullulanibacillus sp. KACC 23026]